MNILIRYWAIVCWCALQLRIILATGSFCIYQKNCSVSLQEEYVDPAWILLRAVIYLETNSITIGPFFLCFKRKFIEKCPPPYFWRKFYGGKFNFDDNWASHKVRTLLAYLSFSYVWNIKKHILQNTIKIQFWFSKTLQNLYVKVKIFKSLLILFFRFQFVSINFEVCNFSFI